MRNAIRVDEIDGYLRDGGEIENILIETEPTDHKRLFSRVGLEVDQEKEIAHNKWWRQIHG